VIFRVDTQSEQPLFEQLATQVRLAIVHGQVTLGERLPAAGEVAQALDVNVHTVLHAYQVLRDEGLIELRRGRGAVVTYNAATDLVAVRRTLGDFVRATRKAGLAPEAAFALLREELLR
jgi:GntR family transcriptional regulator